MAKKDWFVFPERKPEPLPSESLNRATAIFIIYQACGVTINYARQIAEANWSMHDQIAPGELGRLIRDYYKYQCKENR